MSIYIKRLNVTKSNLLSLEPRFSIRTHINLWHVTIEQTKVSELQRYKNLGFINGNINFNYKNATEKVKSGAKIITASNDNDGVAMVLESILTPQAKED